MPPLAVDVTFEERYWYPDEGGAVWLAGYQPVDPADGRFLGRDDPALAERGLHVAAVAGARMHHGEALQSERVGPGLPLELRRDPDNEHDPCAVAVHPDGGGDQLGWVPRELAAEIAPEMDAGRLWSAVCLREQRPSPREARTGLTMLLAPSSEVELHVVSRARRR